MFINVAIYKFMGPGFMKIYVYGYGMSKWLHVYTCGDIIIHVAIYKFMWLMFIHMASHISKQLHVYTCGCSLFIAMCIFMWLIVYSCCLCIFMLIC